MRWRLKAMVSLLTVAAGIGCAVKEKTEKPPMHFSATDIIHQYNTEAGFGTETELFGVTGESARGEGSGSRKTFVESDKPFTFSVKVPEGNYRVTVMVESSWFEDKAPSETLIKSEGRRVMTGVIRAKGGERLVQTFMVNVRDPRYPGGEVKLNERERNARSRTWDDKLTLEFCGNHPTLSDITIARDDSAPTVFLAGDSTVTDQQNEPYVGWGQMLPQFFNDRIAIANHAESGRSLKSFKAENRWAKLVSQVRPGDWVLIQFGHNDMKQTGEGVGPYTSFSTSLREYIADVRSKQGNPLLLTPMHRRKFDESGQIKPTFGDYPDAIRKVAASENVPLIDLQEMSRPLYEHLGPETSKLMFVHFPANTFPGQTTALVDDTHFRAFGGDQIARCVVEGIRRSNLPLARFVRPEVPRFDPSHPGDPEGFHLPPSPVTPTTKPEGR